MLITVFLKKCLFCTAFYSFLLPPFKREKQTFYYATIKLDFFVEKNRHLCQKNQVKTNGNFTPLTSIITVSINAI